MGAPKILSPRSEALNCIFNFFCTAVAHYSIKELEHLSGIKAHTLRIWEQRYELLRPKRTSTNIRFYDDTDLKHLLNVALLNQRGYKISRIAKMSAEQMLQEVLSLSVAPATHEQLMHQLIVAMVELDELAFEQALRQAVAQLGFHTAMLEVIYPFLVRIGLLWQTENITPAHEHFMSNLIRQKILVAIDGQSLTRKSDSFRFLLYLPEGELHEIGLLYMHYLLRAEGHHTLYLGQSLPLADLVQAYQQFQPHYLCTLVTTTPIKEEISQHFRDVLEQLPQASILFSGLPQVMVQNPLPPQVRHFQEVEDFTCWLPTLQPTKVQ